MAVPVIRTDRLILRGHTRADFAACCALWGHPEVTRFIGGRPSTSEEVWSRLLRYVGHWQIMTFGYLLVTDATTGVVMGEVGLANFQRDCDPPLGDTPEAGWVLLPDYHGQGYAREALTGLLDWATGQGISRTVCLIHPDNAASRRLATSLGYLEYARTTYKDAPSIMLERG